MTPLLQSIRSGKHIVSPTPGIPALLRDTLWCYPTSVVDPTWKTYHLIDSSSSSQQPFNLINQSATTVNNSSTSSIDQLPPPTTLHLATATDTTDQVLLTELVIPPPRLIRPGKHVTSLTRPCLGIPASLSDNLWHNPTSTVDLPWKMYHLIDSS